MKPFQEFARKVNMVLAEWNPLGVDKEVALSEYESYIPFIISVSRDKNLLKECLVNMLNRSMEVGYEEMNPIHRQNLDTICDKIFDILKE